MEIKKDAYGKEIYAYLKDHSVPEIIERDDGYIDAGFGSIKTYFSAFGDWPEVEKSASKFIKGKVLDIGSGAGRVGLHLQNKGYEVISIDNSPFAIKVCKLRGVKNAKVMSITEINRFKPKTFDTIVMFGNNFGLFGDYNKAKKLLRELYRITSDKALIIATTRDPYKTNDPDHLDYQKANLKRGRMAGQIRLRVRFQRCVGEWFDYLFVSKGEMNDILKGTGWKVRKFITGKQNYAAIIEKQKRTR
jgi:SAM-dependent methyltransferase